MERGRVFDPCSPSHKVNDLLTRLEEPTEAKIFNLFTLISTGPPISNTLTSTLIMG